MRLAEDHECSGCWACVEVCPKQCIEMKPDNEGFPRPVINYSQCINCGFCEKVCPVKSPIKEKNEETKAYGAFSKNDAIREQSTSGGVFTELCRWVFTRGGVIFGAAFDSDYSVKHCCVENEADLWRLRGAKYTQSDLEGVFSSVKSYLEKGRIVLFSGTPCQVAGLQAFLRKSWKSLILVDLICHGIPSPAVWRHYVEYRSYMDTNGELPISIHLRSKETGWPEYSVRFLYENGTCYQVKNFADPFMRAFVGNLCLRPSCYACKFKGIQRTSDFTLGDYWGVEGQVPELHDGKGTSLVFLHSDKADAIWREISQQLFFCEVSPESAIRYNPSAIHSAVQTDKRSVFMEKYSERDAATLIADLLPEQKKIKTTPFRRIIYRVLGKVFQNM